MLRPERMSKVSVTGAKAVMPTVIETLHDLELVHLESYDGSWEGFEPGRSMAGADELSERLVTIRSIESILGVDRDEIEPATDVGTANIDERIDAIRDRVNELDDDKTEYRSELRAVEEELSRVSPLAELGVDLDLYRGYDSLDVAVGAADPSAVETALEAAESIAGFELFSANQTVAIFASPTDGGQSHPIEDALVGVEFTPIEIPDADGDPTTYLEGLQERRTELEASLDEVTTELEELRVTEGPFLVAVERTLTTNVEKKEAPLGFATTERSFVAEGWIPTPTFETLASRIEESVDGRIVVDELERVSYEEAADHHGDHDDEDIDETPSMHGENPPVIQDNPSPAKPFELLVNLVSRPRYRELDPTLIVFLTFPLAFGFMIGDIGYGILYALMGVALLRFDSEVMSALGWIAIWVGAFTALFGWFYDDIFGVHMADISLVEPIYPYFFGAGIFDKGLQASEWAQLWLIVAILFGILHLNIGFLMGFINHRVHGLKAATMENLSWILAMNGFFLWVFSTSAVAPFDIAGMDITAPDVKPAFLVGPESVLAEFVGFAGLPAVVGALGLVGLIVGVTMVAFGEGIEGMVESPAYIMGHTLSYLRMTAVLLAKGGMAFVVNVLVFGGYVREGGYVIFRLPGTDVSGLEADFPGLIWMDPLLLTIPAAILVFILGHLLVLLLGITAAGIQMTRLEWVEFFQKFYEGGGDPYEPYGADRYGTGESR